MRASPAITIGITLGDPYGIGPEVAISAAAARSWRRTIRRVIIGSKRVVDSYCRRSQLPMLPVWTASSVDPVCCYYDPTPDFIPIASSVGKPTASGAKVATTWVAYAVEQAMTGRFDGIVTAPLSKEGLSMAGITYPGHTEMLANLTGTAAYAMMLVGGPLRVALATRHIAVSQIAQALRKETIIEAVTLVEKALPWMAVKSRVIAICALNPHAGDGGLLGTEENTIIIPAIRHLRQQGLNVEGPIPADTAFYKAYRGSYGAIVAMYHDQGLAPLKMIAFNTGVNITLGLPIVRTSPDHGTAYDIAWKGMADATSMVFAIRTAIQLARRKNPWHRTAQ